MGERSNTMASIGDATLTGWRGAAGRAIAKPVAEHTRFTQAQVEAVIGLALLAYATYRIARPLIAASRR
jgi:hypothetical protein